MMNALPMGMLTWNDVSEMDKAKPNRHVYPPIEVKPVLHQASEREKRIVRKQLDFARAQQDTPWWPLTGSEIMLAGKGDAKVKNGEKEGAKGVTVSLKRGSAYIPRYSDKFRRLGFDSSTVNVQDGTKSNENGKSSQTEGCMSNESNLLDTLQREAFPINLWRSYVVGETRRQERKQEASFAASKKRKGDWKRIVEGVESTGGEDAPSDGLPSDEDEEAAEDQDEYEDDVEDDYADNYFDNGEDDDVGDAEGGGDADVYD